MKVKTEWVYSTETETKRLLHCARQIAVGFYRINNFIVLPYSPKVKNQLIVTFPDLQYTRIPRFWEKVKHLDVDDLPLTIEPRIVKWIKTLLEADKLPKPDYLKTQKLWAKAQNEIISEIYRIMPEKAGKIKKITFYPTSFGTGSSFNFFNKKGEVIIYLRQDKSIATITEAIITSITREEIYKDLGGVWSESEIITDWLVTKSSIAKVLQKYASLDAYMPTIKGTRVKETAKLIAESDEFYKKLGVPSIEKVFGLNGRTPEINKKPVENLSIKEKETLRLLIENRGGVVAFDDIGDEENFSLYAISKTIERLRTKLEANGVSGSYIQTLRGKGYLLKN